MKTRLAIAVLCASMAVGISQTAIPNSSLAHYRIAEAFFLEGKYQSAANEFNAALKGDRLPKWTVVWSHINMGKIFDIVGQREPAVIQYKLAEKTKDNTKGALDEAAQYLKSPFQRK